MRLDSAMEGNVESYIQRQYMERHLYLGMGARIESQSIPNGYSGQDWAQKRPRIWNNIHVGSGPKDLGHFRLLSQAHKWGARLEVEQLGLESACNVEFLHGKQMLNPLCYDIHPEILNLIWISRKIWITVSLKCFPLAFDSIVLSGFSPASL